MGTHMDNNHMDNNYMDIDICRRIQGTKLNREVRRPIPLKTVLRIRNPIQNRRHIRHIHHVDNLEASPSPFPTYPILAGRRERG